VGLLFFKCTSNALLGAQQSEVQPIVRTEDSLHDALTRLAKYSERNFSKIENGKIGICSPEAQVLQDA
jgi:hypothetical protein